MCDNNPFGTELYSYNMTVYPSQDPKDISKAHIISYDGVWDVNLNIKKG
jgi:hypothetical protein